MYHACILYYYTGVLSLYALHQILTELTHFCRLRNKSYVSTTVLRMLLNESRAYFE